MIASTPMMELSFRESWLSVQSRRLLLKRFYQPADVGAAHDLIAFQFRNLIGNFMNRWEMASFGVGADRVVVGHPLTHNVVQMFLTKQNELNRLQNAMRQTMPLTPTN